MPATTTTSPAVFAQLADILETLAADEHIKVDDPVTTAARLIAALDDAGTTLADQKLLDEIGAELADAERKLADYPNFEISTDAGKPTHVRIEHKSLGVIEGYVESRSAADRRARLNDAVGRELLGAYAMPNPFLRSVMGL
ncbi:hypothetical protein GS504_15820 [Rhodococcus hoagii]|nr:hypothetical protein [Prescottella equi]NKS58922.1 hypothetical protein [Prescottella equi]